MGDEMNINKSYIIDAITDGVYTSYTREWEGEPQAFINGHYGVHLYSVMSLPQPEFIKANRSNSKLWDEIKGLDPIRAAVDLIFDHKPTPEEFFDWLVE
jgi:hypothetical protein